MDVILPAVDAKNIYLSYSKKTPVLQGVDLLVKYVALYMYSAFLIACSKSASKPV